MPPNRNQYVKEKYMKTSMLFIFLSLVFNIWDAVAAESLYTYDCDALNSDSKISYFHLRQEFKDGIVINGEDLLEEVSNSVNSFSYEGDIQTLEADSIILDKGLRSGTGFGYARLVNADSSEKFICRLDWSPY